MSLIDVYDDIVACTDVLTAGTEESKVILNILTLVLLNVVFESFVSKQIEFHKEVDSFKAETNRLKGENEAKDIKLKLSRFVAHHNILLEAIFNFRNSLEQQMNENADLKERIKEYVSHHDNSTTNVTMPCVLGKAVHNSEGPHRIG